jgi:hypothetical protein
MSYLYYSLIMPHKVEEFWPQCSPLIASAISTHPEPEPIEELHNKLIEGKLELLVGFSELKVVKSVLVLRYVQSSQGVIAHVQAAAGRDMIKSHQEWLVLKDWLYKKGVFRIQLNCQNLQARLWELLGFEQAYKVMWLDL